MSDEKAIVLNPMQMLLEIAPQKTAMAQCGRGSGKSTGAALKMKNVMLDIPRSKNFILNETYQSALTRTLPSTINALGMLGFEQNVHFFMGRYPPKNWNWPKSYQYPQDPKHSLFFANGTVWDMLSQDVSSRGANYCSGFVDETQDIDRHKFESEVLPTMRLEYQRFKDRKTYRSLALFCSMPRTRKQEWIFDYEQHAKQDPKNFLFISCNSYVNKFNLPPDWFTDQKRILAPSEYDTEILNIRPKKIIGGFYPFFDDKKHTYVAFNNDYLDGLMDNANFDVTAVLSKHNNSLQDLDVIPDRPLEIAMDYGAWFNGIVTGQENSLNEFKFLNAMSIDESKKFEDLIVEWCEYYRFHKVKTVYYYYDQTAIARDSRTDSYKDIVCKVLRNHGWLVIEMYIGAQPSHDDRYKFWGYAHQGDHPKLPTFSYNRTHCKWLIVAINNADLKQGRNGFEKNKDDEKNKSIDQRTTTHFTDAHDTLALGKYANRLNSSSITTPRFRSGASR